MSRWLPSEGSHFAKPPVVEKHFIGTTQDSMNSNSKETINTNLIYNSSPRRDTDVSEDDDRVLLEDLPIQLPNSIRLI